MATALVIPKVLDYPAICACGHSEWIYGFTQGEIEYQKKTRARFFCTGCSISPKTQEFVDEVGTMPWLDYEGKRQWVLKRVREAVRRGDL